MNVPKSVASTLLALGLLLSAAPALSIASPTTETGMGPTPIYSVSLHGDFVVGSNSTRQTSTGDPQGTGLPQGSPFNVNIAGIPAGAVVVKAYANWSYQSDTPNIGSAAEANITINGNPVAGALSGSAIPDLIWTHQGTDAYTADVTGIIAAGGNGPYSIGGAVDAATPNSFGEGISILAVWELPTAAYNQIDVYSGLTTTESGGALATFGFAPAPYQGGPTHFFINALDGQSQYTDQASINGTNIAAGGTINGLGPLGNTWEGLVGPNATSNIYDHAEGDSSPFMNLGDTLLTVATKGHGNTGGVLEDAIGHSFGAIAFAVPVPELSTFALAVTGAMALALLARRRK